MINAKHQRGQSMLQIIFYMAVGGFVVTCILKLAPIYITNMTVAKSLEGLKEEPDTADLKNNQIILKVKSRLAANSVRGVAEQSIQVKREKSQIIITANYEERLAFLSNIDVVVKFANQVEIAEKKSSP